GDVISVGILLPAQRGRRLDGETVGLDAGARVRRGTEPQRVRPECRRRQVLVVAPVLDEEAHVIEDTSGWFPICFVAGPAAERRRSSRTGTRSRRCSRRTGASCSRG